MRLRTRALKMVRATPLRPLADWALLNVLPGAAERRKHSTIDRVTDVLIRTVLKGGGRGVDIGAHTGVLLEAMVGASPGRRHLAIEPIPSLAANLRKNFRDDDAHVVECLLGSNAFVEASGGSATINVNVDDPGYSSVVRTSHPRLAKSRTVPVEVPVTTLDALVGTDRVDLIKLDVEGFELEVLRGAESVLTRCRPWLILEHERVDDDDVGSESVELFDLMQRCGLELLPLENWNDPRASVLDRDTFPAAYLAGTSYFVARASQS